MHEQFVQKGYVTKVQEPKRPTSRWYLPLVPVLRPDKDTTKLRIVFGASARYEDHSLNNLSHPGPKLQQELLVFRTAIQTTISCTCM